MNPCGLPSTVTVTESGIVVMARRDSLELVSFSNERL